MRVAFVSMYTHHTRDTAVTRRFHRLAKLLVERDHEVTVLCGRWWDGSHPTFEQDDIEYRAVDGDFSSRLFISKLPFSVRRAAPDVVHVPNSPPAHARTAKATCRLLRVPLIVEWWADESTDSAADYRKVARGADRVIAPSQTVKTAVREHGAADDAIDVIPESIDFSLVESAPTEDRIDLVYNRQLDENANVETFLLALAELRDRDWRAAVIGDGPAVADAQQTARDLRIRDRIAFVGDIPDAERVSILKGAHVFAQTAEVEPFATNLLWALACGCVGISEYQIDSAAHELVEGKSRLEGTRGSLVSTPQELADEIIAAGKLEHRTVDPAYEVYDHSVIVTQYLDCYREAIDSRGLF